MIASCSSDETLLLFGRLVAKLVTRFKLFLTDTTNNTNTTVVLLIVVELRVLETTFPLAAVTPAHPAHPYHTNGREETRSLLI